VSALLVHVDGVQALVSNIFLFLLLLLGMPFVSVKNLV